MNEFGLINKYLKPLTKGNTNALNLKDDIFFDFSKRLAVSMDTYIHKVHFLSSSPKFFLKKILRSSLSDLYCKGINPKYYFLSLSLNSKFAKKKWLVEFKNVLNKE